MQAAKYEEVLPIDFREQEILGIFKLGARERICEKSRL